MTDVLPTATGSESAQADDELIRDAFNALPHEFKAELVDGEIHIMSPTGDVSGRAAENILMSLRRHERVIGGRSRGDNHAFVVDLPNRKSFSPDASFTRVSLPSVGFVRGAPDFAVEVRSAGDYGARMEGKLARKRADYFAAGTQVVWDVDVVQGPDVVRVYRADRPDAPDVFRRGELADAEPAVPGWRFAVDELFD